MGSFSFPLTLCGRPEKSLNNMGRFDYGKARERVWFCCCAALLILGTLSGCGNRQLFDTTYTFDRAIISMPDGSIISGTVSSWKDYEDGDQIQVVIDGTTYLVHSSNIVLMNE